MPSGNAYRPGDIVTTYDGKHVEIVNTDAEGRVVLADAIAYARRDLGAAAIVDLATLTGACGVALGEYAAGFWSSDDKLRNAFSTRPPRPAKPSGSCRSMRSIRTRSRAMLRSSKNSGGRLGGACTARLFSRLLPRIRLGASGHRLYRSSRERSRGPRARGDRIRHSDARRVSRELEVARAIVGAGLCQGVAAGFEPKRGKRNPVCCM